MRLLDRVRFCFVFTFIVLLSLAVLQGCSGGGTSGSVPSEGGAVPVPESCTISGNLTDYLTGNAVAGAQCTIQAEDVGFQPFSGAL